MTRIDQPRVFLSTGERSGDHLVAEIARNLIAVNSQIEISAVAQAETRSLGIPCFADGTLISDVGNINPDIYKVWTRVFKKLITYLKERPPDVFIGVTHHGFNLALARQLRDDARKAGRPPPITVMVGPPEVWGWDFRLWVKKLLNDGLWKVAAGIKKDERLKIAPFYLKRGDSTLECFDYVFCLNSLEYQVYKSLSTKLGREKSAEQQQQLQLVGHPSQELESSSKQIFLAGERERIRRRCRVDVTHKLVGVFPGSRLGPIELLLPIMIQSAVSIAQKHPETVIVLSVSDSGFEGKILSIVDRLVQQCSNEVRVLVLAEEAESLLAACDYAVLSSGTITLQAACVGVPAVVAYTFRKSRFRWLLNLAVKQNCLPGTNIKAPFGLPNALLLSVDSVGGNLYREYTMENCKSDRIADGLEELFANPNARADVLKRAPLIFDCIRNPKAEDDAAAGSREAPMKTVAKFIADLAEQQAM
jgi:lipid-A-disaccharide synthase